MHQSASASTPSSAMARPVVLGFLLLCAACLCGSTPVPEITSSALWAQTFEQVEDMPKKGRVVNPDPWRYDHRISLFRLLISATDKHMRCIGTNKTDNPLWGLALHLSYLRNSERLADPSGSTDCGVQTEKPLCISPQSWWSCESYFSSVLPFLSATKHNIFGKGVKVEMQRSPGDERYCTTYTQCTAKYSAAMSKWDTFFQGLKASNCSQPDNKKKDHLLGLFWAAQMASKYSAAACKDKQTLYSFEEGNFTENWIASAEYLSAARFQSNFQNSAKLLAPLPRRRLKAGDVAPNIADMTEEENHALSTFSWMRTVNNVLGGRLVFLWERGMCSVNTRQKGQELLKQLTVNPNITTTRFVSMMTNMTTECWL